MSNITTAYLRNIFIIFMVVFGCVWQLQAQDLGLRSLERTLDVHIIDVGYGDAILIRMPDSSFLLIDGGEKEYSQRLLGYLSAQKVQHIDTVVITHPHTNHFEGVSAILNTVSIGRVFINGDDQAEEGYDDLLNKIRKQKIPITTLQKGSLLNQWPEDVSIDVLHPSDLRGGANDNSIVLWLTYQKTSFLFTGDIGIKQQKKLFDTFPFIADADFVQIPHHGGPVSDPFISGFSKAIFVVSTGPNKWGWPNESELQRMDGTILRTDQDGPIVVRSDGRRLHIVKP